MAVAAPFILYTAGQWAVLLGVLLVALLLKAWVVTWIYKDVKRTGRNTTPWLVSAIILDIPTLVVWLFKRPPTPRPAPPRAAPRPAPEAGAGFVPAGIGPTAVERPDARAAFRAGQEPVATTTPATTMAGVAPLVGQAQPGAPAVRVTCPRCGERFPVQRNVDAPTVVTCPQCGASGRI